MAAAERSVGLVVYCCAPLVGAGWSLANVNMLKTVTFSQLLCSKIFHKKMNTGQYVMIRDGLKLFVAPTSILCDACKTVSKRKDYECGSVPLRSSLRIPSMPYAKQNVLKIC